MQRLSVYLNLHMEMGLQMLAFSLPMLSKHPLHTHPIMNTLFW